MSTKESEEIAALKAELARLTAALSVAESRSALALEATNDGVWDWDIVKDEAFFSRRWKGILGYEEHEVENTAPAFFALVHDDDRARVQAAIEAHFEHRVPYRAEFRMRTKDGGWREIRARGQAVWDEQGRPLRMAGVHTDMTEHRERERERLHNEELIAIQSETIRALGVPILQVWRGILCLPIIGAVDDVRANEMTAELLERANEGTIRFVILDLTAAEFREGTVEYLARMTRTLGLLGTRGVLCGIRPETAQNLANIDLDVAEASIHRNLGEALRACLLDLTHSR